MMRKFFYITSFFMFMLIKNASADINVAVIAPLNGEFQKQGQEIISGAKIAVDEINDAGGLLGEKINLVTIDDPCRDVLEVSTAQMIAVNSSEKDKINLIVGPYCTDNFSEVADIYAKAGILQIMPTPVAEVESRENHPSLIKIAAGTEQQSLEFFKFYISRYPDKKLALVYDGSRKDIVETAAALQQEFYKAGKSADFKSFNFANYDKDYAQMAEDIVDEKFSIAYIIGQAKEVSRLAGELKREDREFIIFADRYQVGQLFLEELGSLANGSYLLGLPTLKDNPDFTETLVKMRLLGIEPEGLSVYSYSAIKLWEELVNQSKSFDYAKLSEAVNNGSFSMAWGNVAFNNGQAENAVKYSIYQVNDGEYTQVY